mmetsp:Transcript_25213/g.62247  ORF Transcript_25213/g.62247 Transcript_25213/m.62247 type:complete len:285 (-) Transcript_25213:875-1729(-)
MVSIFSRMPSSDGYSSLNDAASGLRSHAAATALPSSAAPAPPSEWCVHSTQSSAPAAMDATLMVSCSAGVSVGNLLMATTTGIPNFMVFWIWRTRLHTPACTSSTFSLVYAWSKGLPAVTAGPPPCSLSARTVVTITAQCGFRPEERHLRLTNFSRPMSAPNPASVMTKPPLPTMGSAIWSAMMDELPDAMLAKGPACTSTGVPSTVCSSVGFRASRISATSAPVMPRSSAVTGTPCMSGATTMLPRRASMSDRDVVMASTAMISDATVMSNPVWRVCPFSVEF